MKNDAREQFERALGILSIDVSFMATVNHSNGDSFYDYIVELSKYELLYLELAAKAESITRAFDYTPIDK